ncbi:MAG: glycosyltransferase family 8 protein (plasmid) [Leptolyngbya sp. IPPAS B-1204]
MTKQMEPNQATFSPEDPTSISTQSQPIVLVCAADENYAMPMAVMVYSALSNLKNNQQKLLLYILDGGIWPATQQKVVNSLRQFKQLEINWTQPEPALFQDLSVTRYLTRTAYYRLLMPQVLPSHLNKAIYLDCDMIVQGDLTELWQMDLGEHYVLAVLDDNQPLVSMAVGLSNYRELGLNPNQKYFNSGLLVVNLKKWRVDNIGMKVIEYSKRNREYIRDADQDGLNAVFTGNWGELNPRWNQMPRIYTYESWQDSPYDQTQYELLKNNPLIIHYTNAPKPWRSGCQHPATSLFYAYLDQTAWSGWRDTWWRRVARKAQKGVGKVKRGLHRLGL